jgi:hypothetical protein
MAISVANECKAAALAGMAALLNSGQFRLLTSADAELANLTFGSTAFGTPTTASPSVATSNAITADATITAGTIAKFELRTSAGATRISGSVGVGTGDLQVSDTVIPGTATSVSCPGGLTLSLQIT